MTASNIAPMIRDLCDGETCIYANSESEYHDFTAYLHDKGAEFVYHFETGEGYRYQGKIVEVNGL